MPSPERDREKRTKPRTYRRDQTGFLKKTKGKIWNPGMRRIAEGMNLKPDFLTATQEALVFERYCLQNDIHPEAFRYFETL